MLSNFAKIDCFFPQLYLTLITTDFSSIFFLNDAPTYTNLNLYNFQFSSPKNSTKSFNTSSRNHKKKPSTHAQPFLSHILILAPHARSLAEKSIYLPQRRSVIIEWPSIKPNAHRRRPPPTRAPSSLRFLHTRADNGPLVAFSYVDLAPPASCGLLPPAYARPPFGESFRPGLYIRRV